MTKMTGPLLAVCAAIVALAVIGGTVFQRQIGEAFYSRQVEARLGVDRTDGLPDGLHAAFCGTGSPLPDTTRADSCTLVIAGERIFVVDSGSGSTANLVLMGVPVGRIEAALLTHFHSDHISDLGDLAMQRWVGAANTAPLPVHGPQGVETVVAGFNTAYSLDHGYRTGHHGAAIAPPSGSGLEARLIDFPEDAGAHAPVTLLDEDGLRIRAVQVDHDPAAPALAYRFDYGGRSLVVSGDLEIEDSLGFGQFADGADLWIIEALQPALVSKITRRADEIGLENLSTITIDILDYHTTPEQAAAAAQAGGADALVLTHIVPAVPSRLLHAAFLGEAGGMFDGPVRVARDGDAVIMPAGSDRIEYEAWLTRP